MDDHSRFIVSYGLHASQSSALVLEVLRSGIASYGSPEEILTLLRQRFTPLHSEYWPLRVPAVNLNLCIGITLTRPAEG